MAVLMTDESLGVVREGVEEEAEEEEKNDSVENDEGEREVDEQVDIKSNLSLLVYECLAYSKDSGG